MLNLDMVERNSPDSLMIQGTSRCPELKIINEEMNKKVGFSFIYSDDELAQSDQANFLKQNIPALFFTSGLEPEYHQVTDEISLIDTEKIAKVSRLVFYTAQYIANDNKHYKLLSKKINLF
jgi:Zn-dependent M28 family amino/carboxypeptidase